MIETTDNCNEKGQFGDNQIGRRLYWFLQLNLKGLNFRKQAMSRSVLAILIFVFCGTNVFAARESLGEQYLKGDLFQSNGFKIDDRSLKGGGNAKTAINSQVATPGYWYGDDDIRSILSSKLGSKAYVAPALPFENTELIKAIVADSVKEAQAGRPVLIPVNLNNNHWVALAIRKNEAGKLQVFFNDSLGNPLSRLVNANLLTETVLNIYPGAKIQDLQVRQQSDGSSCSAFTAENLIAIAELDIGDISDAELKEILGKITDAQKIRDGHLRLLQSLTAYGHLKSNSAKEEGDIMSRLHQLNMARSTKKLFAEINTIEASIDSLNSMIQGRIFHLSDQNSLSYLFDPEGFAAGEDWEMEARDSGVWVQSYIGRAKAGRDNESSDKASEVISNRSGYKSNIHGFILGLDTSITEENLLGIAFGMNFSQVKFADSFIYYDSSAHNIVPMSQGSTSKISALSYTIYGASKIDENIDLFAKISYGRLLVKSTKEILPPLLTKSKCSGDFINAGFALGYTYPLNDSLSLIPTAGISYDYINLKKFREGDIDISKRSNRSLGIAPAIAISSNIDLDTYSIIPKIHFGMSAPLIKRAAQVTIRDNFSGQTRILKQGSQGMLFKIGASALITTERSEVLVGYDYSKQREVTGHMVFAGLRVNF